MGRIDFTFKGYFQVEGYGEHARFTYDLEILDFDEASAIPELGFDWQEHYGEGGPVTMKRQGESVPRPMGSMSGDPRESFLKTGSEAWVSPWGKALRHGGRLPPARYQTRADAIGPYFFKGLQVENWAHACFVWMPPEAKASLVPGVKETLAPEAKASLAPEATKSRTTLKGEREIPVHVQGSEGERPIPETWEVVREGGEIRWSSRWNQALAVAKVQGLSRAVKDWNISHVEQATLDPASGMAKEVRVEERGGWMEAVTLGKKALNNTSPPWIKSRFHYRFRAYRP